MTKIASATFVLPRKLMKLVDNAGKSITTKKVNNKYEAEFGSGATFFGLTGLILGT